MEYVHVIFAQEQQHRVRAPSYLVTDLVWIACHRVLLFLHFATVSSRYSFGSYQGADAAKLAQKEQH